MLFPIDTHEGLRSGAITVTFRVWKRAQARRGARHHVGDFVVEVDEVRVVRWGDVTDADVRAAGFAERDGLSRHLARRVRQLAPGAELTPETELFRIDLHYAGPDERRVLRESDDLTSEEVADITKRLARLDAAAAEGPWTRAVLDIIDRRPETVSTDLAAELGRERFALKADIRKLKRLGLTESLNPGYRLSPRGRAYLTRSPAQGLPSRSAP